MIKSFNKVLNLNDIISVYKNHAPSEALCLLWDKSQLPNLIISEGRDVIETENEEGVETDGNTELLIH